MKFQTAIVLALLAVTGAVSSVDPADDSHHDERELTYYNSYPSYSYSVRIGHGDKSID